MNNSLYGSAVPPPPPPAGRPPLHADASNSRYRDDDNGSEASDPRYRPLSAPPAGAPPTPPPTPPAWNAKTSSFRADYGTQGGGQDSTNHAVAASSSFRGDATLRPNIGLTNSYEYALFGWTLDELIVNLRTVNLVATSLTLLWIVLSWVWLGSLITLQLSRLVLLGYLAILSLALFLVDIMGFYRTQLTERGIMRNNSTHTFVMEERIRDQLGLLYHPAGKAFFIFSMALLCASLGNYPILRVIALLYCFSAFGYLYAYCTYPEFRREEGSTTQASVSTGTRNVWTKQAWTTTSLTSRGLAEAAARNWSSRWGLGTGPEEEEPGEADSFLRHHQANSTYVYV